MPEKDGDEGKSTKSVVNKKQKQMMGEEGYDIARDMGRVRPSKDKKDATTMPQSKRKKVKGDTPMQKEFKKKYGKKATALDAVKQKYKGQIMKVEELDLTQVAEAFGGYIVEKKKSNPTLDDLMKQQNVPRGSSFFDRVTSGQDKEARADYDNLTAKEKEEFRNITKEYEGSRRQKPPITGDSGQRDRARVTFGQGKEPKKRAPRKGVDYFFDPKKAKAERERTAAKRKEYEIDDKGNITDRGVEKYARQMYRTNEPLTKDQLSKAKEFAVGGKEVKDSKGKVIGKTTGKYGGTMSPLASEKEMKKTKAYLKKRGLTKSFTGDKPPSKDEVKPQKDKVTVNTTDTDKVATPKTEPEKGPLAKAQEFARKNPIGGYAAVELGKGIIGKLMKVKGAVPGVVGGTVGRRSARGGGGL